MIDPKAWRNLAIDRANRNGMDAERFRYDDILVCAWNADVSTSRDQESLCWELRNNQFSGKWVVFGAVFANASSSYLRVTPFLVESERDRTRARQRISFDIGGVLPPREYACFIELDAVFDSSRYDMVAAGVTVSAISGGAVLKQIEENFPGTGQTAVAGKMMVLTCPDCRGLGYTTTFAIPKEERESGLTGYALYSANTINGKLGCTACGGEGVFYERWYLDENPRLAASETHLRIGTGKIRQPCVPLPGLGVVPD